MSTEVSPLAVGWVEMGSSDPWETRVCDWLEMSLGDLTSKEFYSLRA